VGHEFHEARAGSLQRPGHDQRAPAAPQACTHVQQLQQLCALSPSMWCAAASAGAQVPCACAVDFDPVHGGPLPAPQQHATAAPALGNHATALSLSAVLRIVWAVTAPGPGVSAWADRCCRADARCTSPDAPQCLHPALIASGIPTPYSLYIQVDCQASYCALLPRIGEPRRQHSFRRAHAQHRASGEPGINACTVLLAPACPWDVAARSQIDASPHGVQSLGAVQAAVQATGRQCRPHHQADTGTQGPP